MAKKQQRERLNLDDIMGDTYGKYITNDVIRELVRELRVARKVVEAYGNRFEPWLYDSCTCDVCVAYREYRALFQLPPAPDKTEGDKTLDERGG